MREKQQTMFGESEPKEGSVEWARRELYKRVHLEMKEGTTVTFSEAARFLNVSPAAILDLVNRGRLRAWSFGKTRVVVFEEVKEYDRLRKRDALPSGGRGRKAGLVLAGK